MNTKVCIFGDENVQSATLLLLIHILKGERVTLSWKGENCIYITYFKWKRKMVSFA